MKKNNGFSLLELITVVAIIAILFAMAYPSYRDYMFRVEQTKMLNDLSIIVRDVQLSIVSGDYGGSEYSADKLLAMAPGGKETDAGSQRRCIDVGIGLQRLIWKNPSEIAKILSNSTSKIKNLDIETFKKNSACKLADINPNQNRDNLYSNFFIRPDYKAYGYNLNDDDHRLAVIMGGSVEYLAKDGVTVVRKLDSTNNLACYIHLNLRGTLPELPISAVPPHCRYRAIQTYTPGTNSVLIKLVPLG